MSQKKKSEQLKEYQRKRDFGVTPEPAGNVVSDNGNSFVIQKHAASHLHYDFRLELNGVLKSWAVPKGPSLDPSKRSLAVHVEDHPLDYGEFEGVIPEGEYGGGTVMLWDRGTWEPKGDPLASYRKGKLYFTLHGEKLHGEWRLFRMSGDAGEGGKNWLLQKVKDDQARPASEGLITDELDLSVESGRSIEEIAEDANRTWTRAGERKSPQKRRRTSNANKNGKAKVKSAGAMTSNGSSAGKNRKPVSKSLSKNSKSTVRESLAAAAEERGGVKRKLPAVVHPQLATLVREVPKGDNWIHEIKYDGYRLIARFSAIGKPTLFTRRGHDWTAKFPSISSALAELDLRNSVLDGEVVVVASDGTTDFQALQNQIKRREGANLVFYAFDLLFLEGIDCRELPQIDRKELLRETLSVVDSGGTIRYSDHIEGTGESVYIEACRHELEGIIAKRADARYVEKRTDNWVKVKCIRRQEFVIGGWTDPKGSRIGFGSLLIGWHDQEEEFRYAGKVGTGFTADSIEQIHAKLTRLSRKTSPFSDGPTGSDASDVHWVTPKLLAEVEFTEFTRSGTLRHPSFQGLRQDKDPKEITIEKPKSIESIRHEFQKESGSKAASIPKERADKAEIAGVRLSNPDRILYPDQGITKLQLAEYYRSVEEWILPYLIGRPLSLVRCPRGRDRHCFYQKHLTDGMPDEVRGIDVGEDGEEEIYVAVDDLSGIVSLVQMGTLELHPWGSREDRLDRPDIIVFDLDPGPGVDFRDITEATLAVHDFLDEIGLQSFARTSGGKGLHVVVPIDRRSNWDEAKDFARDVSRHFEREYPERYIATASKAKRKGKIYIDYLRNARGATAIASYSTRAREGAPVATPLRWDEVSKLTSADQYNVTNLPIRLSRLKSDPWEEFFTARQSITRSVRDKVRG